ncbi:MAG: glycosyltransferase, partial [Candidatus Margulisbacteria bacterium]|nr:glycosyltransferase [Candidatus Margulisiibacteriota bacterium]
QLGIGEAITFSGYVSNDDVYRSFSVSELFLFPSKTETQGLTITEGFAMGVPAVCINAMGVSDVLENQSGGFLTQDSLQDFSDAAIKLLTDQSLYEEKKREALERVKDYETEHISQKMLSIYEETIHSFMAS